MIDQSRFNELLARYKADFVAEQWEEEKYKWQAVKQFQDSWDISADDFPAMLQQSLSKTSNLLASMGNFPRQVITNFAQVAPEAVREMFASLFDESADIFERMSAFKQKSAELLDQHGNGAKHHYQTENTISTYLWLRYPDTYYIYKFKYARKLAEEVGSGYQFKSGDYANNVRNYLVISNEVCAALQADEEMGALLRSQLTDDCYPDPQLHTLTVDFCFYISQLPAEPEERPAEQGESTPAHESFVEPIREEDPVVLEQSMEPYTIEDFLSEVFMSRERYEQLVGVLRTKKNVILQGAPGVGKTFAANRLAWSMMGEKDSSRIEFVQFHQNYSYEDFIMGYKPSGEGFELRSGIFYRFCQKAAENPAKEYFFIIDEINRGNLSKIFGELLVLIERDYRGTTATLAYNGQPFAVPENVYILGMMNTADRSLAMIDYALRRRFSFFEMEPGFDSEGFTAYRETIPSETFNVLISCVKDLNQAITQDRSLGKGFCIGHSYFCGPGVGTEEGLRAVVDYDILPMLAEYWFDDEPKIQHWRSVLLGVFQH